MIYSVWNQGAGRYDYYQTPEPQPTANTPAPNHLPSAGGRLGVSPARAAWPLPAKAVKVGSGEHPRGRIAAAKKGLAGLAGIDGIDVGVGAVVAFAAVGMFLIWKTSK